MVIEGKQTFEGLGQLIRDSAERDNAEIRDPEGDIEPMVYLYKPGSKTLHVHSLAVIMSAPDYQAQFIARTKLAIMVGGVRLVGMRVTAYGAWISKDDLTPEQVEQFERGERPDGILTPEEYPEREEAIWAHVFDSEIVKSWKAVINRDPLLPPTLEPWQMERGMRGMMIEPILEALR